MKQIIILLWILLLSPQQKVTTTVWTAEAEPIVVTALIPDVVKLARLVQAEAANQSDDCKHWVVQVVINRSREWNMTIYDVISQSNQFDGYNNSRYCRTLDTTLYKLCKEVYINPIYHNYLFFLNPDKSTDTSWVKYSLKQKGEYCDDHYFY